MKDVRIQVKLGGQQHTLVFDTYAMAMLDEYLGESIISALRWLNAKQTFSVKLVAALVLAGLQHNEDFARGMDIRKTCKLLPKTGLMNMVEYAQPIIEAVVKCLGFDEYTKHVPEEARTEHPTVSPSKPTGELNGENSASSPVQPDASQPSSGA